MTELEEQLLKQWLKRSRESQLAHYRAEENKSRLHLFIGVPAAVLSAIVGTAVFAALDAEHGQVDIRIKIGVGMISVLSAVLTGCQTFLRFSDRAEEHRVAASKFAAIRRRIEQILTCPNALKPETIEELRKSIDEVSTSAPPVSARTYRKAMKASGPEFLYSIAK